ncbi:HNH endonuclease [Agromyces archimandritae]|uniref:HNH endonuclease n=1 Tax=Agromyces archimandritae TaxID=2781962 RepID=A0A975FPY6_9MICO|nr:HNH endonuclease [Agromyces archimandritae]QTX05672.1 HNH endonuclease [Agromyces archimandritae]
MPLPLRDYLELTVDDARKQWLRVATRSQPAPGARQEDYRPVESLMCFFLGLDSPLSENGHLNLRTSDPRVQLFAQQFKRSEKSLSSKLNNLVGRDGRSKGAKHEREVGIELTNSPSLLQALYAVLIEGARQAGLGRDQVPDFLGLETREFQAVNDSVRARAAEYNDEVDDRLRLLDATETVDRVTEKMVRGTVRVGQQVFARQVLAASSFACAFCGLSALKHGMPSSRLLVASHIKAWSVSSSADRLNPSNGIAACPTHDAAFESHLIGIDHSGRILRSKAVIDAVAVDASWERSFGDATLAPQLLVTSASKLPDPIFVDYYAAEAAQLQVEYLSWPLPAPLADRLAAQ